MKRDSTRACLVYERRPTLIVETRARAVDASDDVSLRQLRARRGTYLSE